MRIVAGSLKGRTIEAPDGTDTRPTIDRVREALFSSLYSLLGGFDGCRVLDGFAGSGALGIEALSRGAQSALFYERDAKAASVLRKNLASCKLGADRARIVQRDIFKTPPTGQAADETAGRAANTAAGGAAGRATGAAAARAAAQNAAFDLVLLDPPYAYDPDEVLGFVVSLVQAGAIDSEAIIVYEHSIKSKRESVEAAERHGLDVIAEKKYGKTGVLLMRPV